MRSAELLQQPACGDGDDGRSVRVDDNEPGRHAGVEPDHADARLTARGGVVVVVEGLAHRACSIGRRLISSVHPSSGHGANARRGSASALHRVHSIEEAWALGTPRATVHPQLR